MDPNDALAELVRRFEEAVWNAPDPPAPPPADAALLPAECASGGVSFARVLELQTDETLALAVKRDVHRRPAFVELFERRYRRLLMLWFTRWRHQLADAENLTQDLLIHLFQDTLQGYDPDLGRFSAYLYRIAYHVLVSAGRRKRPDLLGDSVDKLGPDATALSVAEREMRHRLGLALNQLSPDHRTVLDLSLSGLGPSEIARKTDLRIQRVYRLLFEARQFLRRTLGDGPESL
jgi:RNA polymerase sigma factor (sigma-70 family)